MAKSPVKNPPIAQVEAGEASVPSLVVESADSLSIVGGSEAAPILDPPAASISASEDSFGAGVWNNSKKVNALFSTNEVRNSWMHIVGTGWVKLANNIDSANESLNVLATAAKVKNSPINYLQEGGQVTQIYVW
jgi:hypothetical protein